MIAAKAACTVLLRVSERARSAGRKLIFALKYGDFNELVEFPLYVRDVLLPTITSASEETCNEGGTKRIRP